MSFSTLGVYGRVHGGVGVWTPHGVDNSRSEPLIDGECVREGHHLYHQSIDCLLITNGKVIGNTIQCHTIARALLREPHAGGISRASNAGFESAS